MDDRVYSQKEMSTILERVAELQAEQSNDVDQAGLTLTELEIAAAEAGLDPKLLHRAVAEYEMDNVLDGPRQSDTSATHIFENRWIHGEIDDEAWEDLVFELRHRFDSDTGKALGMPMYGLSTTESIGRAREWKHISPLGVETRLLLRSWQSGTRISISQKVGIASTTAESIMYGSILTIFVTLIAAAISKSAIVATLVTLATLMSVIPLIYMADKAWRNKKHGQLQKLADASVTILNANQARGASSGPAHLASGARADTSDSLLGEIDTFGKDAETVKSDLQRRDSGPRVSDGQ
ncbi:MAG: hypothetical protein HKN43_02965 [Rhodothermales bacterium]|nr:hypothetical protein [Rhodothermales bacterium]